jgi:hypothetical protein
MHLTLNRETTPPAAETILRQQARFDAFQAEFTCNPCARAVYALVCRLTSTQLGFLLVKTKR